jgi:hypothetical protein
MEVVLEDDDLWFPNHLAELSRLLKYADFGHTLHVWGHPDGKIESLPSNISLDYFRKRFIDGVFNRFGYSTCGHRLEAYRRLPDGWSPSPVGMFPDLHMWRKFMRMSEFRFDTRMVVSAINLPDHMRAEMSVDQRIRESREWLARVMDPLAREDITEAAWRSVVIKGLQCEDDQQRIMGSRSMRWTRPLRATLGAIRRARRGGGSSFQ